MPSEDLIPRGTTGKVDVRRLREMLDDAAQLEDNR
jgi:hypothetical protein